MALPLPPAIASPQHRTPVRKPMHGPQNVGNVVLGNLRITPEYPSFYPEDLIGGRKAQWLYVCHWCFRYTHELMKYAAHCVSLSCLSRLETQRNECADVECAEGVFCQRRCADRGGCL